MVNFTSQMLSAKIKIILSFYFPLLLNIYYNFGPIYKQKFFFMSNIFNLSERNKEEWGKNYS